MEFQPWHIPLILLTLVILVLWIAAIVSIVKHPHASTTAKVVWILVVLVFPFLGSLIWFVTGRRALNPSGPA